MLYNFGNGFMSNKEHFGTLGVFEIENEDKYECFVKHFDKRTELHIYLCQICLCCMKSMTFTYVFWNLMEVDDGGK